MSARTLRIWCPEWCTVPEQQHIDDLPEWDNLVLHHGESTGCAGGDTYELSSITFPDGTPAVDVPDEHADVMLIAGNSSLVHPDELECHARLLLELVAQARAQQKERQR